LGRTHTSGVAKKQKKAAFIRKRSPTKHLPVVLTPQGKFTRLLNALRLAREAWVRGCDEILGKRLRAAVTEVVKQANDTDGHPKLARGCGETILTFNGEPSFPP